MKEYDYILANVLNPGFSNLDFKDTIGMNTGNTQLLPYSSYTSSPFITLNELFQDNNGLFSERKFKDFYTAQVGKFATFDVDQPMIENFEYSIFDSSRKLNSRVKDPGFKLSVVSNPDRITTGIAGRNQRENSKLSSSEIALQSKIWDSVNKKWLDYSPNDISLVKNPIGWFKSLFEEPLIKATWDEEGDHKDPITKKIVHHYKGDLRLNDLGEYFYETLGGRSTIGKEVLSSFDILTIDGEGLNKYDFIDTDDLDKSVTGTIAKTALTVAPLFLGGPYAAIYSGALIAREMGKSLPMLYGMVSSLWGNTQDSKLLNTVAAYGDKFSSGTSEYSKQNTFTFENIAALIGDVATQWGQQKAIANSVTKLRGSNKAIEEAYQKAAAYYSLEARQIQLGAISALLKKQMSGLSPLQYIGNPEKWQESALGRAAIKKFVEPALKLAKSQMRLGADASLAYMAIISNTDVYASMLEHGASKRDAAAIAFGSTLGMFGVDRYLGLGELFFDELRNDARLAMRNAFRKEADAAAEMLIGHGSPISNPEAKLNALKGLIKRGMDFSKGITEKFASDVKNHATGFFGKALGEGFEEVAEELVTDLSKQLYQLAGQFSPNFINLSGITDVGAWENMKERYLMSLLGGTLGGGLFYGVETFLRGSFKRDTSKDELIYLIANNRTNEALKELDRWKAAGKFASKNLSATRYEYDTNGNPVFLTAENEDDSQNTFIYNRIKESILLLESILNETGTNLSEEDLFKQMVLSEQRFLDMLEFLQDLSYVTKYQELFRVMTKDLIDAEKSLEMAYKTVDGTPNGELLPDAAGTLVLNNPVRLENIEKLKQKVEDLRALRDSFKKGEQSLPYTEKMLFAIDKFLNSAFVSMTYGEWLKTNKGKNIEDLSESEKKVFKEEYLKYKELQQPWDLDQAFEIYKSIKDIVNPHIAELAENASSFEKNSVILLKLFDEDGPLSKFVEMNYEDRLEGESDEDYNNRNTLLEDEEEADFKKRKKDRIDKINAHNQLVLLTLKDEINATIQESGGYIDPSTQRYIHNNFKVRRNDQANDIISSFISRRQFAEKPGTTTMKALEAMKKLKPDMSNYNEVREEILDLVREPHRKNVEKRNRDLKPIMNGLFRMFNDFGYLYDPNTVTGDTVLDFMNTVATRILAKDPELEAKLIGMKRKKYLLSLYESDDILNDLLQFEPSEDGLLEYYLGEDGENLEATDWSPILASINKLGEGYDMHIYSLEEMNDIVELESAEGINWTEQTLTELRDRVESDTLILLMDEVDKAVTDTNPITKLLKQIHVAIDPLNRSVEDILDALYRKSLSIDSLDNFTISEDEELAVRDAIQLLSTVKAYLYAAGSDSSFAFPVGHNKVINEFAKNHKDIYPNFNELPTLDLSVSDMYILEIDKYLQELSEDSGTSWISLSNSNKINKRLKLINAELRFNDAKLEVLSVLSKSDAVKFVAKGKSYNLLEGIDSINDEEPAVRLHKIENLFYKKLHEAIADGLTFKEILEASHLLDNLPGTGTITSQITSELDDTIEYGKLTKFDTFVYLLTISGISSTDFNKFIKERVEESKAADPDKKIVPLTIQEHTSRIALAQINSKEIFSLALEYLKESTNDLRPILDYLVFIDGSAGVGKTQVIARNASKFILSDKIWLSAPKDTQLKTLKEVIGKGLTKTRTDLFNLIMDPATYQKLLTQMKGSVNNTDLFNTKDLPGKNKALILNLEAIKFNDIEDLPELIIIDEVTHFSGLEMLILNAFAKKNGISILALGDTNLNGFTGLSRNMDREKLIAVRSPKLSISLRDVNLLKQENLLNTLHILNSMSKLDSDIDPLYELKFKDLTKLISLLNFRVYNLGELNGDLITENLSSEQASKLFGTVAFIGNTNDEAYLKLKEKEGSNIEKVIVIQPDEVQGLEFDFIVVDLNWELDTSVDVKVLNFLANLYTMMSRGRIGSIFIDKGLSNIIGQNKESFSQEKAPNLREAIEPFINAKLEILNMLDLDSEESTTTEKDKGTSEEGNGEKSDSNEGTEILPEDETLQVESENEPDEEVALDREAMKKALGDKTDEVIEKSLRNIELDKDFPIRIYGSAHLAGLMKTKRKNSEGKEVTVYVNPHSEVKSDLQVFMKGNEAEGEEMDRLVKQLLNLKSIILYGDDLRFLDSSVSEVVDADHLKNVKYKLEVRPRSNSTDHFVGFTGLQEDGEGGNRIDLNGLVYSIVAEFKNNAEETCKITLGLLANPDSYFIYRKSNNPEIETEAQYKERQRIAEPQILRYKALFDNITKKYNEEGSFYEDVTPNFSGLTHVRRTTGVGNSRKDVPVMTLELFKNTHPYTVVSDPYIYVGDNMKGLDSAKIRGHAVVFVSDDTTLKPEELMDIYIQQKEATASNPNADLFNLSIKPRVRMIMLDTVGVSFKSLTYTQKMKDLFSTELMINGKKVIKMFPFEEDYMGARMLTSLWNYRANLKKFLNAYLNFDWTLSDGTKLSDDDIYRIATYADALYKKNDSSSSELEDNVQQILSTMKATDEEIQLLNKFNDSLATEVRLFRIGGSRKQSGVYLRNLTNISSDNVFYKGLEETPVGIYITHATAEKQYNLINTLLNDTFGGLIQLKDKEGKAWPETRTISSKDGYSNSLSGLLTLAKAVGGTDATIDLVEDGIEYSLQLPNFKSFTYVPIILRDVYNKLRNLLNNPEDAVYDNITIGKNGPNPQKISYLKLSKLLNQSTDNYFDSSFDDLLALAFHGTTANPSRFVKVPGKELDGKNSSMRATDAYFKDGLYIDPMAAEVVGSTTTGHALFRRCLTDNRLFTINVDIDMPIFTVTLANLEQAYNNSEKPVVNLEEIIPLDLKDYYSNPANVPPAILNDVQELFSTVESVKEFQLKASEIINNYYLKTVVPSHFLNPQRPEVLLNSIWSHGEEPGSIVTVRQHLEQLIGKSLEGARADWDNGNLLLTLPDGLTKVTVSFDEYSDDFSITKTIAETEEDSSEGTTLDKLQTAKDYIAKYLVDPANLEKLNDFRIEYEAEYDELINGINSYGSIDDLIKAITNMISSTDSDEVILEIAELVASANENLKCKYS